MKTLPASLQYRRFDPTDQLHVLLEIERLGDVERKTPDVISGLNYWLQQWRAFGNGSVVPYFSGEKIHINWPKGRGQ